MAKIDASILEALAQAIVSSVHELDAYLEKYGVI